MAGKGDTRAFRKDMRRIVEDFTKIPRDGVVRPKVGIVGEILLKYHPDANNHVAQHIMDEGGEPVLTDIMDFFLYCFMDPMYRWKRLGGRILPALGSWLFIMRVEMLRASMRKALEGSIFMPVSRIRHLSHSVKGIISRGNQAGEGWLLTAEMLELIDNGATNVLCLQPFGCLPNHITGKGVMKELKRLRPAANLMAVDYDPGSSEANQLNRIKLFMSVAHTGLEQRAQAGSGPETPPASQADGESASANPPREAGAASSLRRVDGLACRACGLGGDLRESEQGAQS